MTWIWPTLVTIIALLSAVAFAPKPRSTGYFPDFGSVIVTGVYLLLAVIASLIAWLVWALI